MSNQNPEFEHLFDFGNVYSITLSIKHILVILMIGIALYCSLILSHPQAVTPPELVAALAKPFLG